MAAGKEYSFTVDVDDDKGQPFGPVNKENLDVSRFIIDFTCWLDTGETLDNIQFIKVLANPPQTVPPWQADYPLDETSASVVPTDLYPLTVTDNTINTDGDIVTLMVAAGTPGLTYALSFCVTSGSTRRRQVDILVVIDMPLNPANVSPAPISPTPPPAPLVINGTTALPIGFSGRLYVENTSGAPITVTLPTSPTLGDLIMPVDISKNAGTYTITYVGAQSSLIEGMANFQSTINGDDLGFEWNGTGWFVRTNKYGLLA